MLAKSVRGSTTNENLQAEQWASVNERPLNSEYFVPAGSVAAPQT